jgi:predicted O-linked N-acetylglucosamine transferase (SPINDLY family)
MLVEQKVAAANISSMVSKAVETHKKGDLLNAKELYLQILEIDHLNYNAIHMLGVIASQEKKFNLSIELLQEAVLIKPDDPRAFYNLGLAAYELGKLNLAEEYYLKSLELKNESKELYSNLASTYKQLRNLDVAIKYYQKAIGIDRHRKEDLSNLAFCYTDVNDHERAIKAYKAALKIDPKMSWIAGYSLYSQLKICEWSRYHQEIDSMRNRVLQDEQTAPNFIVSTMIDELNLQLKASQIWVGTPSGDPALGPLKVQPHKAKIRLGYYSADFYNHATCMLMAELFEKHDKSKFELFAFSFGLDIKDPMRARVEAAFDQFIDVSTMSDKEIAEFSRMLDIDIAIDLKGSTKDHRFGIFSYRAAPVQVSYLGYPGTMGAEYIDYLIADKTLIPEESQKFYTEKIAYMPHSYQVNDRSRVISDRVFTKQEVGLPEEGFVFACFNSNYKITPDVFDVWVRILKSVDGSVLWILEENKTVFANLRKEAKKRGLEPERLVFAQKMELSEHLARHKLADLFVDTLPCNAHTTASDALWAGLPVLTCMGESFASRVAASLLNAIEMPELITRSLEEYEELAIALGRDPKRVQALKQKLELNKLTTPLFDSSFFTKNIENLYLQMSQRYQLELEPESLVPSVILV